MAQRASARTRLPRGEGERLRDEIVAASAALLAEAGTSEGVSIRAVSAEVGVTPPAIYMHFQDKEALLLAAAARAFEPFPSALRAAFSSSEDPVEALRAGGHAYVSFGLAHPEAYRLLLSPQSPRSGGELELEEAPGLSAFLLLVRAVQACIEEERLRDDLDAFAASVSFWLGLHGLTAAWLSHPGFPFLPLERTIDDLLDVMFRGLLRR